MSDDLLSVPSSLVQVAQHTGPGFAPVMDFSGWRVAISRHNPANAGKKLRSVQRHNETNEVFILTQGAAQMLIMDGDTPPTQPHIFDLEPNVVYNVQQGVWHATFLSPDAHIIIFERTDTGAHNSDVFELDAATVDEILAQVTIV